MTTRKDVERIMNEGCERPISRDGSIVEVLPLSADAKKMFADALQAIDTLREALKAYIERQELDEYSQIDEFDNSIGIEALSATDAMKKE
jgi:hypothetical protein